jgi:hypothetical protein
MKVGAVALVIGLLLLGVGIFLMGDRSGQINLWAYLIGLLLTTAAVTRLVYAGWHGSPGSWLVAAPGAAVLTWTLYELVRQQLPMPQIGVLGEMTAPTVSIAVAGATVVIGALRLSRPRDIPNAD